jgi:hypothetical protein
VIDRTGQWWTGDSFPDLADYIREYSSRSYEAGRVEQSRCGALLQTARRSGYSLGVEDDHVLQPPVIQ